MSIDPPRRAQRTAGALALVFLAAFMTTLDRVAFPVLIEPIRLEFSLTDTVVGLLVGAAFTLTHALASIPMARWADVGDRRVVMAVAMAVWSVMTALGGLAQSVWQLFVSRVGTGFGEAGSLPPAQSIIADLYPPERRSLPLALLTLAITMGGALGYALVGMLAELVGWRNTLLLLGSPGMLVALLLYTRLSDPRDRSSSPARHEGLQAVAMRLFRKRSFRHIAAGYAIGGLANYGLGPWFPSFFVRTHGLSLAEFGVWMGALTGGCSLVGLLAGGLIANRALAKDLRWGLWLPALGYFCYTLSVAGAIFVPTPALAFGLLAIGTTLIMVAVPPIFAVTSGIAGAEARTVSMAFLALVAVVIGGGAGPFLVGVLSDSLQARFGAESLRYSLALLTPLLLWAAVHFALGARTLRSEFEDPLSSGMSGATGVPAASSNGQERSLREPTSAA